MLKRILVPVDMSACSLAALRYGAFLGEHSGAQLYVLHVARSFDTAVDSAEQLGGSTQAAAGAAPIRDFLQDVERAIVKEAHVEVICGDVSEAILRAAAQHKIDIIVMGSHGEGDSHGSVIGHVVKDVASRAECAIVPVFPPTNGAGLFSLCAPAADDALGDASDEAVAYVDVTDVDERPSAGALRSGSAAELRSGLRSPTH